MLLVFVFKLGILSVKSSYIKLFQVLNSNTEFYCMGVLYLLSLTLMDMYVISNAKTNIEHT